MKRELDRRGITYVDTKPVLLAHCRRKEVAIETLYGGDGGHHNAEANRIIGDAVVTALGRLGVK